MGKRFYAEHRGLYFWCVIDREAHQDEDIVLSGIDTKKHAENHARRYGEIMKEETAIAAHEAWANDPAADPICERCGEPTCAGTC